MRVRCVSVLSFSRSVLTFSYLGCGKTERRKPPKTARFPQTFLGLRGLVGVRFKAQERERERLRVFRSRYTFRAPLFFWWFENLVPKQRENTRGAKMKSEGGGGRGEKINARESAPVSHQPLPSVPPNSQKFASQMLFYQYAEPEWSKTYAKSVLAFMNQTGKTLGVTGRGRLSQEGVNCTLTAPNPESAREFCEKLREFDEIFMETDFKITDFVEHNQRFKQLTIVPKDELVAYGLAKEKAPSLKQNKSKHVNAIEYHEMLKDKDSVVIDVRNHYEVDIGRIVPPEGGATFLNPEMRNSHEFPKWLNLPETKKQLEGKRVMMYCTGGIRCERASALISQMERVGDLKETKGIAMVRGGVDRYLKTFPESGGFWKGKNYLFDLREAQMAEKEGDLGASGSKCCVCDRAWSKYEGKFVCGDQKCKVPVLVCDGCRNKIEANTKKKSFKRHGNSWNPANKNSDPHDAKNLRCPLCKVGKDLRSVEPVDSAAQKRLLTLEGGNAKINASNKRPRKESKTLFIGKLPLSVTATEIKNALKLNEEEGADKIGGVAEIQWMMDSKTGFFYGSAIAKLSSKDQCRNLLEKYKKDPPRIQNKFIAVGYFDEDWKNKKKKNEKKEDYKRLFRSGERPPVTC